VKKLKYESRAKDHFFTGEFFSGKMVKTNVNDQETIADQMNSAKQKEGVHGYALFSRRISV
jgi:hypothetical protein